MPIELLGNSMSSLLVGLTSGEEVDEVLSAVDYKVTQKGYDWKWEMQVSFSKCGSLTCLIQQQPYKLCLISFSSFYQVHTGVKHNLYQSAGWLVK